MLWEEKDLVNIWMSGVCWGNVVNEVDEVFIFMVFRVGR